MDMYAPLNAEPSAAMRTPLRLPAVAVPGGLAFRA